MIILEFLCFPNNIFKNWSFNTNAEKNASMLNTYNNEEYYFRTSKPVVLGKISKRTLIHDFKNCCSSDYWDSMLNSDSLKNSQLKQYFLWTNHSSCKLSHDIGGKMMKNPSGIAGQKSVCIDPMVAPNPSHCLVYSFGINFEWSFDEQMELYGCEVYSFDPSMGINKHNHSPGIHFYDWGLGDRDEYDKELNWTIRSLSSIYKTLSLQHGSKIIDYLKIDIEYSEWIALPQIIKSGMLSYIRQLGIEIHVDPHKSVSENRELAKLLRLIEKNGMIRFDSKSNPWFTGIFGNSFGYEIAWYNNMFR